MINSQSASRRSFLKASSSVAAAGVLTGEMAAGVHADEDNTIQLALVGCGGRGTGATTNALSVDAGPVRLVAMADVFDSNLTNSYGNLSKSFGDQEGKLDVPEDRKFIGFDAYQKAMDCLKPGDIVILTTPPGFRWVHYQYAIERGLNVFMEKPITVDGPATRKMLALNERALEKNLKVGVGLMCRHCDARRELFDRIQNGEIGDLTMLRAYRMAGPTGSAAAPPKPEGISELMHQIKHFHGFLWLSGGAVSDFLIHNIDESCWMKNAWPVEAKACGGRHYRGNTIDQNFDTYSIEYTFDDGAKLFVNGRTMPGCHSEFASYAHGTKGLGIISSRSHWPSRARIYNGQKAHKEKLVWEYPQPERHNPYQAEWEHLLAAVRNDDAYNEVERGAMASVVTSMGRMAAHTGQTITLDQMMNCEHEFSPGIEDLTFESDSPVMPNAQGKYPIPYPGLVKNREYA